MSTKLYNGIKFKSNKLGVVIRQLNSLKEDARKNVMETFTNTGCFNFRMMCVLYGDSLKKGKKVEDAWDFERILRNELRKPNNSFNYMFGVTIFERKNKLYGIYFDHTYKNFEMLFDRDIAVDYHYQNQTDKPDDVSWRNWNFREQVWEDIFEDISCLWIPKEAGVSYDIVDINDIYVTKDMMVDIREGYKEIEKRRKERTKEMEERKDGDDVF